MIRDKILVFVPYENISINNGGPPGFIAHNYLNKSRDFFDLSSDLIERHRYSLKIKRFLKAHLFRKRVNFARLIFNVVGAKSYKYIYFHDCFSFESCRDLISSNQVVIFQSHSPELPSQELVGLGSSDSQIDFARKAEVNSFNRADIIVFPNEGCVGLYDELNLEKSRIQYILSGCQAAKDLRAYPLDNNRINFLYIGRRNFIKGFDIVLDSFLKALKIRKDLNLLLIGGGEVVREPNIYDVGFSNTPTNWYNSVDYVINANRQSYFDLSVLEALSTNSKLILSTNFGHQYYENKSEDIIAFNSNNSQELVDIIIKSQKGKTNSLSNLNLFYNELSDIKYFERFLAFSNSILH